MSRGRPPRSEAEKATAVERRVEKLREHLQQAIERAERAESGMGIGHCAICKHWERQGPEYAWGRCGLTEVVETINWPWRGDPDQTIHTKENFGCIRFVPELRRQAAEGAR